MTTTPQRKSVEEVVREKLKHFDFLEKTPYLGNHEASISEFEALVETVSNLLSETEAELVKRIKKMSQACLPDSYSKSEDIISRSAVQKIIKEVFKKQS